MADDIWCEQLSTNLNTAFVTARECIPALAAGQGGTHPGPRETHGHSMIVDPWGAVLAEHARGEALLLAGRDPVEQAAIRQRMPVARHRRFFSAADVRLPGVE